MKIIIYIFVSLLALSASFSIEAENAAEVIIQPIDKLISELTENSTQHAAVAKYYREKSTEAKNEAEHHRRLKQIYSTTGHPKYSKRMISHCENLINIFETESNEYREMASEHEKLAH